MSRVSEFCFLTDASGGFPRRVYTDTRAKKQTNKKIKMTQFITNLGFSLKAYMEPLVLVKILWINEP